LVSARLGRNVCSDRRGKRWREEKALLGAGRAGGVGCAAAYPTVQQSLQLLITGTALAAHRV
jgi:hypothetical protein